MPSIDDEIAVADGDPRVVGGLTRRKAPVSGLRPSVRFVIAFSLTLGWVGFSIWASRIWRGELEDAIGPVMAWVIPTFLAYIPGLVIWFMIFTLLITRYQELPLEPPKGDWPDGQWPSVTILVAAWNESEAIVRTLERIGELSYGGRVAVVVADNNSTDDTPLLADAAGARLPFQYRRVFEVKQGKHHALNAALATVTTPLVVTVDADTLLHPQSLTRLVVRVMHAPQGQHVCACAAALVAENPLATLVTRMQQWDYRLGINGVKRMQAAYNTALVAQGAFSVYRTGDLRAVGGWPDAIGEDIVLTWTMLATRGLVQYEPVALGFTAVPEQLGTRDVRRPSHPSAAQTAPRARESGHRSRLPRPLHRHRRHLLLGSRRDPLSLRLPVDLRLVVDAPAPDHTRRLRALTAVAGPPRLPDARHPPRA
jgi:biofilm PGA synthesis N-glycosyltransferase PgaC